MKYTKSKQNHFLGNPSKKKKYVCVQFQAKSLDTHPGSQTIF